MTHVLANNRGQPVTETPNLFVIVHVL